MPADARAADVGPAVTPSLTRTAPAVVSSLMACGVVAAHEVSGGGLLDPSLRPIQRGIRIAGSAVTVLCPPDDNLSIHLAVERCVPGDVLVVAVTQPSDSGVLGELLATSLRAHGVIGAVIDAGVRDIAELREMGFPVWSRWVSARGTTKRAAGSVNQSVLCAGQVVEPGDVIVADDDGVVCVAAGSAAQMAGRATERVAHERVLRARLAAGELSVDLLGLRAAAEDAGLEPGDT
jgi:4-hydroxy-4-methyl-2-oxoglutarate aldolase